VLFLQLHLAIMLWCQPILMNVMNLIW